MDFGGGGYRRSSPPPCMNPCISDVVVSLGPRLSTLNLMVHNSSGSLSDTITVRCFKILTFKLLVLEAVYLCVSISSVLTQIRWNFLSIAFVCRLCLHWLDLGAANTECLQNHSKLSTTIYMIIYKFTNFTRN